MKKYLLIALTASGLLVGCSNTEEPLTPSTTTSTTTTSTSTDVAAAPTTVLITTSVVAPPQSGSAVLRPVLKTLKDTSAAPAELPAGSVVLSSEEGKAYLAGNVLSEGNIFADAQVSQQADNSYVLTAVLREGAQGVDIFNAAAAGCAKKDPTCPSGIIAITVNDKLVGTVAVRGAVSSSTISLEGALDKATADSFTRLITGRE